MAEQNYSPFSGYGGGRGGRAPAHNRDAQLGKKLMQVDYSNQQGVVPAKWKVFSAKNIKQYDVSAVGAETAAPSTPVTPMTDDEAAAWRKEHSVTIFGENCPVPFSSFAQLGDRVPVQVHKSFQRQGFAAPTMVQAQTWPILFENRDLVGIAKTGSGKTLAFMVPGIAHVEAQPPLQRGDGPICVVLAPTRELAQQIEVEVRKVLPPHLRAACIYGGSSKGPQIQQLSFGVHILIATPGRLIDLLQIEKTNLLRTTYLVMDEADRMLDMGFEPQVRSICSQIRTDRQTLLFSATWPKEIQSIAASFQREFIRIHVGSTELLANPDVTQHFVFARDADKFHELRKIMAKYHNKRILIFAKMKRTADQLERQLRAGGCNAMALHGDKEQSQREWILTKIKREACTVVATDVAARGLDIKELEIVINFDFPMQIDDYVHRIGRTGRAGAKGDAYTLLSVQEPDHVTPWMVGELCKILDKAKQNVPQELREWAARRGNGGYKAKPKPGFGRNQNMPSLTYHGGSRPTQQLSGQKTDRPAGGAFFGVSQQAAPVNPKRQTFSCDSDDDEPPVKKQRPE